MTSKLGILKTFQGELFQPPPCQIGLSKLDFNGFLDSQEPTKDVLRVDIAHTLQHQHGRVAWRIIEPFLYIKNEFWWNKWEKQGFGILFGLDLIGF